LTLSVSSPGLHPAPKFFDVPLSRANISASEAMNVLSRRLRRPVGGSTGTNFLALCRLAAEMRDQGETGSLVTLICDSGERYLQTYYEPQWLAARGLDPALYEAELSAFLETGKPLSLTFEDAQNPQSLRGGA
jgi:cysteine synthase